MDKLERVEVRKSLGEASEKFKLNISVLQHCLSHVKVNVTQNPEMFKQYLNDKMMLRLHICNDMNIKAINNILNEIKANNDKIVPEDDNL